MFELFDGSVVSKIIVTITSTDSFVNDFEVEYKESTSNYRLMRRGSNKIVEKYPVKEGTIYDIRCRAINSIGVKSVHLLLFNMKSIVHLTPPDDVQNYSIDVVGDKLHHTFDAVTNLDLIFMKLDILQIQVKQLMQTQLY